jgi:hypothetical protein
MALSGVRSSAHIGKELRLVLARLFKLPALVLDFIEKSHIFDRDRSLVRERRDQFDLLVSERSHTSTVHG